MATELIVGLIAFGTAVVALATAYVSRTRHVLHRHEHINPVNPTATPASVQSSSQLEDSNENTDCDGETEMPVSAGTENKYGKAAVQAVELIRKSKATPTIAWQKATSELFGADTDSQRKGCPKGAFLGLCQDGHVLGVPHGIYTRSVKNRDYAIKALELLRQEPVLAANAMKLWQRVLDGVEKRHNSQMNVVIALWENGMLSNVELKAAVKQK